MEKTRKNYCCNFDRCQVLSVGMIAIYQELKKGQLSKTMLTLTLFDQGYAPVPQGHLKRNKCSVIGGNSNHFHKEKRLFFDE